MVDKKDLIILDSLVVNARKSIKEISKETGIPRTTVFDRIRKMEHDGIILHYGAVTDYKKLGYDITVFILVKFRHNSRSQRLASDEILRLKGVQEVNIITGEYDLLIKARAKNTDELSSLIVDKIRLIEGVMETVTSTAFSSYEKHTLL